MLADVSHGSGQAIDRPTDRGTEGATKDPGANVALNNAEVKMLKAMIIVEIEEDRKKTMKIMSEVAAHETLKLMVWTFIAGAILGIFFTWINMRAKHYEPQTSKESGQIETPMREVPIILH